MAGKIILALVLILAYAALIFFKGPDVLDLAADFSARVVAAAEKKINAALERWQDILDK